MRLYLLAAAATAAVAVPASAQTGPYVGIEGGILKPRDTNGNVSVDFATGGLADISSSDAFQLDYKRGRDLDVIAGFDLGAFRVEGEIAWKRASLDNIEFDDSVAADLEDAGFDDEDLGLDGNAKVRSLMVNGLFDIPLTARTNAFVGAGVGRARARIGGLTDKSTAMQALAGVRTAIADNVDVGLKYRFFRTGRLGFAASDSFSADVDGDGDVDTGVGTVGTRSRFQSHSLLASLIFNFGAPAAAPAPVLAPPPPPPPPQLTQTCPDGSVIDASAMCPVSPPPPPPPAVAPSGERG
ncbi:MAG TPA: outer membrane beta-barrel protein [Sphingomicrobium sp.]